jgi:crossover junction endodeoxyribonuclease RuvC
VRIIGIDPGLSGAIALYNPATSELDVEDVPIFVLQRGKSKKRHVDLMGVARIIDNFVGCEGPVPIAYVERVSARPGEAPAYAFDFGRTTGILLGVCASHFLRIEQVTPASWKGALKVPALKDGARARASQMFPQHTHLWARAKDDGRAEAALIAFYGAQQLGNTQ